MRCLVITSLHVLIIVVTMVTFQSVQNNGSWYLHVYVTKQGISPNPNDDNYHNNSVVYQRKCKCGCCHGNDLIVTVVTVLTSYKKRRINNKINLLTGTSEVANSVSN